MVAVIADLPAKRWPYDVRTFAVAAKRLAEEGNKFTQQFWITSNSLGSHSPDFREILTLMHSAALISYNSQHWDWFYVEISPRGAAVLKRRTESTPEELEEVKALMLAHWREAMGQDWEKAE